MVKLIDIKTAAGIAKNHQPWYEANVLRCPCDGEPCDRDGNCNNCVFFNDIFGERIEK